MSEEPDPVMTAAAFLAARDPRGWQGLRAEHIADSSGHCRACGGASRAAPVWPCRLAAIAAEAARRCAARRTPTPPAASPLGADTTVDPLSARYPR